MSWQDLLNASDILDQVVLQKDEIPAFNSNMFNDNDLTIDGMSKDKLKQILESQLLIIDEEFESWEFLHS